MLVSFYSDFGIVSILFFAIFTYYSELQSQNVGENDVILLRLKAKLVNLFSFGKSRGKAAILLFSKNNYFRLEQLKMASGNSVN